MKVRWHTMGKSPHSWSFVTQALARAMVNVGGNEIFYKSTDGLENFPDDLKSILLPGYHGNFGLNQDSQSSSSGNFVDYMTEDGQLIKINKPLPEIPDKNMPYDMDLAYTIFFQAPRRFHPSSKMKALIWNFESSIIPYGWHLYHRAIDYILPSSQFSYDIFADGGVPKDKMLVVPHGVDTNLFNPDIPPFPLKTKKKVKFLHNAIPHARKCHDRVLKAYLDAFTGNDDVCLVMKTKFLTPDKSRPFEVDVKKIIEEALRGRKNPAEIEVVTDFVPHIGSLYTATDAVVSLSSTEGFNLTLIEALACNSLVIAPRHGGQLDFLNDGNSLLVNSGEMYAPQSMQYWHYDPKAVVGDPDTKHFAELLRKVYENVDHEKSRIREAAKETTEQFSWENAAKMILDLPIPSRTQPTQPPKRKVLYIVPYAMSGGGEVWVKEMIEKLDRNIYEPHIALLSGKTEALDKLFSGLNATIEDLGNQGRTAALKCLLESENYSIVHFYNSFGVYNVLKECWRQNLRVRIVETVHSDLAWNDAMVKVAKREELVCAIATVSNTMGKKMLKYGNKNTFVIPHSLDWERFEKIERSKEILKEFGVPDSFVVGFVGRLSPEKNIPCILQCAKRLPEVSFVIVGGGPQEQPLKQMAKELKNVFFIGERKDVDKFYASFDLLMLPSNMEGLPFVILEAMLCGLPIIASDVGAISELVSDGINGYTVWNPKDSELFSNAIINVQKQITTMSNNSRIIAKAYKEKSQLMDINTLYSKLY